MGRVVAGRSSEEILQLASDFFMKRDDVHLTMLAARPAMAAPPLGATKWRSMEFGRFRVDESVAH
jgi:hypothetical protein